LQKASAPIRDSQRPGPTPPQHTNIVSRAVRGAFWTILSGTGARVIGILGTLAVTHYLSPKEVGAISIAGLVTLTATTIANAGVSQYIASKPDAERAAVFHATFYYLLLGIVAMGAAVLLGGPFGWLINAPDIGRFLPLLAASTLLDRVCVIQDRIQVRDMRFRSIGLNRSLGELVYSGTSVLLAATCSGTLFGGPFALAWAMMARSVVRLVTLSATTPWREWAEPHRITLAQTREFFSFGVPMSLASIANFGSSKFDNFVYSHHFGEAAVGTYNLAYNFADMPAALIAETVGDVLVPSFAHMDSDERRKKAFLLALEMLVLLVTPLALGLAMVAPDLVAVAFPPSYEAIAQSLRILVLLSVPRTIIWTAISYLQVHHDPRVIMLLEWLRLFGIVLVMHLFIVVARRVFGTEVAILAACTGVVSVFAASSFGYMVALRKLDGVSLADQIRPLLPPAVASVPMMLAVYGTGRALAYLAPLGDPEHPLTTFGRRAAAFGPRLALEVVVGAVAFVPSALLLAPGASRRLIKMVREAGQRRRAGATSLRPQVSGTT
jgi:PST family polysaccharide transporter